MKGRLFIALLGLEQIYREGQVSTFDILGVVC